MCRAAEKRPRGQGPQHIFLISGGGRADHLLVALHQRADALPALSTKSYRSTGAYSW